MLSGCKPTASETGSKTGFYFDTVITLQVSSDRGEQLLDECFAICEKIEQTFSRTLPESELYTINHRSSDELEVSEEMAFLIEAGLKYYELSDGALDITIAPVLELWDFKTEDPVVPDPDDIDQAAVKTDAAKIHLNGRRLSFDSPDTQLDLGALVKGYAADRLKEYLVSNKVESGMINLGGNVLAIGTKTDGSLWKVGIQMPFSPRNETITTISTDGESVVSSGVYERYFELDGIRYHHILNPKNGYPVQTDLWQATVISESSLEGDALSTICLIKGRTAAEEMIEKMDEIRVVLVTDQGELTE